MIVSVARGNTSFDQADDYYLHDKGGVDVLERDEPKSPIEKAGDYALHDKGGGRTSHRVGFTETINLDATDASEAIREMRARYDRFKAQEQHKRGRKLEKPVYTYSLSWSPSERPTKEDMLDAARSSLKAMRLDGLQTLIVQHLDEPQPHIHLIVHRIEADGKRARNIPWDHLRFSKWAEEYERERGKILCEAREANNARRSAGEFVKDHKSLTRKQFEAREKAVRVDPLRWEDRARCITHGLFARHVGERDQLWSAEQAAIKDRVTAIQPAIRALWNDNFDRQHRTKRELQRVLQFGGVLDRAVFVYRHRSLLETTGRIASKELARLCLSPKALTQRLEQAHRRERGQIADVETGWVNKTTRMVRDDYRIQRGEMIARQRLETDLTVAQVALREPPPLATTLHPTTRKRDRDFDREL